MYLTEEQIDALHYTWPDRWIIVRDDEGYCTFAGEIPSDDDVAEAEKSEVYVKFLIREKIDGLEAEITSRRVRDALSGSVEAQRWLDEHEAKIDAERAKLAGPGPGAEADTHASADADANADAAPGGGDDAGAPAETVSVAAVQAGSEASADAPGETDTDDDAPGKPDTGAEAPGETNAGAEALGETNAGAETLGGTDTGVDAPSETDADANTPLVTDAGADAPLETDAGADASLETDAGADAPLETDAGADAPLETDAGADAPLETDAEAGPPAGTDIPPAAPPGEDTGAGLPRNSLDAAVRILLMAVFSDGNKTQGEMDELDRQASIVGGVVTFSAEAPLRSVSQVIDEQILGVRAAMQGPDSGAAVGRTLRAIDDPVVCRKLCEGLAAIAGSDGVIQLSEHQLLARAMETWGIKDMPRA